MHSVKYENLLPIARLCGLTNFTVLGCNEDKLGALLSIGLNHLPIKTLNIAFRYDIERNLSIRQLQDIFNLMNLTTLEIRFWVRSRYPDHFEQELQDVFSKLTNIKHLSLLSQNIKFGKLMSMLKPNSLHSFQLRIIKFSEVVGTISLEDILKHQEGSLRRLYWGHNKTRKGRVYSLQELDRVIKVECRDDNSQELRDDLTQIRKILRGTRFPQLRQVVLNECCYFIKRHSKENIYVVPCNTIMSTNNNNLLEYNLFV
ncbi:hypothetical protein JA1_001480 [Spathaspora sp. JA1]|nr:hypothetical protein JA1_001480 [Spathaspora sp. JA1]